MQVCLTGDRNTHKVTDNDIDLIRRAVAYDARAKGWVVDNPTVSQHGDHQATECPGAHAIARRDEIAAACQAAQTQEDELTPDDRKFITDQLNELKRFTKALVLDVVRQEGISNNAAAAAIHASRRTRSSTSSSERP